MDTRPSNLELTPAGLRIPTPGGNATRAQSLSRFRPQPAGEDGKGDGRHRRGEGAADRGETRIADRTSRSRARHSTAAGGMPGSVRAARRRRVRAQGNRRDARHRGRDIEVAGLQVTHEPAAVTYL